MNEDEDGWLDAEDLWSPSVGTATPITEYAEPIRVPKRAFPPGFHGANPGPSHDEDPPRFIPRR